jgi:hypothetical protein
MTSLATHTSMPARRTPTGGRGMQVSGSGLLATECTETQAGRAFPETEMGFRRAEEGFRRAESPLHRTAMRHRRALVGSRQADTHGRSTEQDCRWPQGRSPSAGGPCLSSKMHSPSADVPHNLRFNLQQQKS